MVRSLKKASFLVLFCLLLALLSACTDKGCDHSLVFVNKKEATCRRDGTEGYYRCLDCDCIFSDSEGKNEISSPQMIKSTHTQTHVPRVKPTCDKDGTEEYYKCSCGKLYSDKLLSKEISEPVKIKKGHTYVNGECTACGEPEPCKNITYAKSSDEDSYRVIGYSGKNERRIVIPEIYDGLPVTEISSFAFAGAENIEQIILPSGITRIAESAFEGCASLKSVSLGKGLLNVEKRAFYGCSSLVEILLGDSVTLIGKEAFFGCSSLRIAMLGGSLKKIEELAFSGCTSLERIALPITVTKIGAGAFSSCTALSELYLADVRSWCYYSGSSYRDYRGEISYKELSEPMSAAKLITEDYCEFFWIKDASKK